MRSLAVQDLEAVELGIKVGGVLAHGVGNSDRWWSGEFGGRMRS